MEFKFFLRQIIMSLKLNH